MAEWRRPRSATRFVGALIDGGARLVRRKPEDLHESMVDRIASAPEAEDRVLAGRLALRSMLSAHASAARIAMPPRLKKQRLCPLR